MRSEQRTSEVPLEPRAPQRPLRSPSQVAAIQLAHLPYYKDAVMVMPVLKVRPRRGIPIPHLPASLVFGPASPPTKAWQRLHLELGCPLQTRDTLSSGSLAKAIDLFRLGIILTGHVVAVRWAPSFKLPYWSRFEGTYASADFDVTHTEGFSLFVRESDVPVVRAGMRLALEESGT